MSDFLRTKRYCNTGFTDWILLTPQKWAIKLTKGSQFCMRFWITFIWVSFSLALDTHLVVMTVWKNVLHVEHTSILSLDRFSSNRNRENTLPCFIVNSNGSACSSLCEPQAVWFHAPQQTTRYWEDSAFLSIDMSIC